MLHTMPIKQLVYVGVKELNPEVIAIRKVEY